MRTLSKTPQSREREEVTEELLPIADWQNLGVMASWVRGQLRPNRDV